MTRQLNEYSSVYTRVWAVIEKLEQRGTQAHSAFAATHRQMWAAHQPEPSEGQTCMKCSQVWPCGVVRGLTVG